VSSAPANLPDEVRAFLSDLQASLSSTPPDISLESSVDLCRTEQTSVQTSLDALSADLARGKALQEHLEDYVAKLNKELPGYLGDIGLTLHRVEGNGQTFFDETLQLRGVIGLLNQRATAEAYLSFVLPDIDHAIDRHVDEIVDWLLSSELAEWKDLSAEVDGDNSALSQVISEQLDARFDYDRSRLSTSLSKMVSDTMEIFDAEANSKAVAEAARNASANSLFLAVAALVALAASAVPEASTGDVPPFGIAAGLAALAVAVIPWARRRAKKQLSRLIAALRMQLQNDLRFRAEKEIEASKAKISELLAAPLEALAQERRALTTRRDTLAVLEIRATELLALENDTGPELPS
jgi:hypothetical protein